MQTRVFLVLLLLVMASACIQQQKQMCVNNAGVEPVMSPGADDEVIELLQSANESIDVEMYVFSYGVLAEELEDAVARGVRVRVILESRLDSGSNEQMADELTLNGIEVKWASQEYKLTHSKLVVVDGKRVLVGSPNWTYSAMRANREMAVIIDDEAIAREFENAFETDWSKAVSAS